MNTTPKQEYDIDARTRTVYTKIKESFHSADKTLGWKFKSEGFGINHIIIKACIVNKFGLSVVSNGKQYKFSYEKIKQIRNELKTDYLLKNGVKLVILPMAWSYSSEKSMDRYV